MQLILKVPHLVKTPYWTDIAFKQVALHDDNWKYIKNLKINDDLLQWIKDFDLKFTSYEPTESDHLLFNLTQWQKLNPITTLLEVEQEQSYEIK